MKHKGRWFGFFFIVVFLQGANCLAFEITDELSIGGILAVAYQYQDVSDAPGFENTGRGAVSFQPEISFRPTEKDELFAELGFAVGNGLNDGTSPFQLKPWGADLEDDVKNINGSGRDYLLTAWYKHTFVFSEKHTLALTGGLIDATDYVDQNAYSNDEYAQFMNEALDNGPNVFVPSYDFGGAVQWAIGDLDLTGVVMSVNENDEGNSYNYYAVELGYAFDWRPGQGNYRVLLDTTSRDFSNPQGTEEESRLRLLLSFDQQLGEILGIWIRFGWQDNKAAINYDSIYSGGINIGGRLWGRENDNVGLGYAYLDGGNKNIESSQVFEGYYRLVITKIFAFTADLQYMKDERRDSDDPKGFIYGVRVTAQF